MSYRHDAISKPIDPFASKYQEALQRCFDLFNEADAAETQKDDIGFYRAAKEINQLAHGPLGKIAQRVSRSQVRQLDEDLTTRMNLDWDDFCEKADSVVTRAQKKIDRAVAKLQTLANQADATDDLETLQKIVHKITTLNTSEKLSFFKAKKDLKAMPANILDKYNAKIVVIKGQLPHSDPAQTAPSPFPQNAIQVPQQILPQHVAPSTTPPASKNTQTTTTTTAPAVHEDHEIKSTLNSWTETDQLSVPNIEKLWDALSKKIPHNSPEQFFSYTLRGSWKKAVQIRFESSQELDDLKNIAKEYLTALETIFIQNKQWYGFDSSACELLKSLSDTLASELQNRVNGYKNMQKLHPKKMAKLYLSRINFVSSNYYPEQSGAELKREWDNGLRDSWNASFKRCYQARTSLNRLQKEDNIEAWLEWLNSKNEQYTLVKTLIDLAIVDLNANSAAVQSPLPPAGLTQTTQVPVSNKKTQVPQTIPSAPVSDLKDALAADKNQNFRIQCTLASWTKVTPPTSRAIELVWDELSEELTLRPPVSANGARSDQLKLLWGQALQAHPFPDNYELQEMAKKYLSNLRFIVFEQKDDSAFNDAACFLLGNLRSSLTSSIDSLIQAYRRKRITDRQVANLNFMCETEGLKPVSDQFCPERASHQLKLMWVQELRSSWNANQNRLIAANARFNNNLDILGNNPDKLLEMVSCLAERHKLMETLIAWC